MIFLLNWPGSLDVFLQFLLVLILIEYPNIEACDSYLIMSFVFSSISAQSGFIGMEKTS